MKKFKAEIYKQLCPITLKWNDQYLAHGRCKNRGSAIMSMILGVGVDPNKSLPLNNVFFLKKGKCISEHSKHDSLRKM